LDLTVIKDMVLWITDKTRSVQLCADNVRSAMMELSQHPEEVAAPIEADLRAACGKANIPWQCEARAAWAMYSQGGGINVNMDLKTYWREPDQL
jgi:hypothetical protein